MIEPSTSTPLPVLIVGGGLGGLTLAHALAKYNIPYKIFERDSASSQRAQGYRFSINDVGADGLRFALSPELFEEFEKTCGDECYPGGRVDAISGRVLRKGVLGIATTGGWSLILDLAFRYFSKRLYSWLSWSSWNQWFTTFRTPRLDIPKGKGGGYKVDRRVLRTTLLASQSSYVTYDSAFTSYTIKPNSVTVHFANGTSETGSLLVGADGVRSKVALQLLGEPKATPLDLGTRVAYGKTPLTPKLESSLHPLLSKGLSFVVEKTSSGHQLILILESMRFHHESAPPDYIFWALSGIKDAFGEDEKLTNKEDNGAEISQKLTERWDPSIRIILTEQNPGETAFLKVTTSNRDGVVDWPTNNRVTLLGDSIHCMPPTGGSGANSALKDAALLAKALGTSGEGGSQGWSVDTVRIYEDAMRYNLGDIVGLACIGAEKLFY